MKLQGLVLGIGLLLLPLLAAAHPPLLGPSVVCPAGTQTCAGLYGRACYQPSAGQRCMNGMICGIGQQLCAGPWGASCYAPSAGQRCMQGVICAAGQQVCSNGGVPQCYSPASGQRCQ